MTEQFAIDVARNAFMVALQIGGPLLIGSLAVGMLVSVFQAVTQINEATLHYVGHGRGMPVVALHGAGVDHREIEAGIEAVVLRAGYRRIYPDLPGMGRSTTDGPSCNDELLDALAAKQPWRQPAKQLWQAEALGPILARRSRAHTDLSAPRCCVLLWETGG